MVVTNFTLRLAHESDKPYTETYSWQKQTLQLDLVMVGTNLTPKLAHGGDKPYTDSPLLVTSLSLLMVVTSLTLRLVHGGDKPYTETYSWWCETLH